MYHIPGLSCRMAFLMGILAFSLAGSSVAASAILGRELGPATATALSTLAGLPPLLVLLPGAGGFRQPKAGVVRCALQALTGMALFRVFLALGMEDCDAGVAGLILASGPLVMSLGGAAFFGERLAVRDAFALIAVAGGTALMRGSGGGRFGWGAVLVFGAVLGESAMHLLRRAAKDEAKPLGSVANAFYTTLWGFAMTLPFAISECAAQGLPRLTVSAWIAVAWYGIGPTAAGYLAWGYAAIRLPAGRLGLATAALPLTALLSGLLFLGESLRPGAAAGWIVALAGIGLSVRGGRGRRAPHPPASACGAAPEPRRMSRDEPRPGQENPAPSRGLQDGVLARPLRQGERPRQRALQAGDPRDNPP